MRKRVKQLWNAVGLGGSSNEVNPSGEGFSNIDAFFYLYGDDDDNAGASVAGQEVQAESKALKCAQMEISAVTQDLTILMGRVQLLSDSENPHEFNAIEEELERLIFRLDDINTQDVHLKKSRRSVLKQVQGALKCLYENKFPQETSRSSSDVEFLHEYVTVDDEIMETDDNHFSEQGDVKPQCIDISLPIIVSGEDSDSDFQNNFDFNMLDPSKSCVSNGMLLNIKLEDKIENLSVNVASTSAAVVETNSTLHSAISSAQQENEIRTTVDPPKIKIKLDPNAIPEDDRRSERNKPTSQTYAMVTKTLPLVSSTFKTQQQSEEALNLAAINSTMLKSEMDHSQLQGEDQGRFNLSNSSNDDDISDAVATTNSTTPLVCQQESEDTQDLTADFLPMLKFKMEHGPVQEEDQAGRCNLSNSSSDSILADVVPTNSTPPASQQQSEDTLNLAAAAPSMLKSEMEHGPVQEKDQAGRCNLSNSSSDSIPADVPTNSTPPASQQQSEEAITNFTPQLESDGPVQLLQQDDEGRFKLDEKALKHILEQESVRHRKLVVISIVGAFRRGKSFLINFMLRYLQANGSADWLEGEKGCMRQQLDGFTWCGGRSRNTTGILMWSQPFLIGNDLAVVLLDTQGTYDSESSMQESNFLFTLSTLISSIEIFNLAERIQLDDLTNLQQFLQFGRMVQSNSETKVFGKLVFLIRDWKFPKDFSFGADGGSQLLAEWLKKKSSQEQVDMIQTCFENVECCLLPNPGDKVHDEDFKGNLEDVHPDFLGHLQTFVEDILREDSLCVKKMGGKLMTAEEFPVYMKTFTERLQSSKFETKALMQALADIAFETARGKAEKFYVQQIEKEFESCGNLSEFHHNMTLNRAVEIFDESYQLGGTELAAAHRKTVREVLEERKKVISHRHEDAVRQFAETEATSALSHYQSAMSAFCYGTLRDPPVNLQTAHDKESKIACQQLESKLQNRLSKENLQKEVDKLKMSTLQIRLMLEPMYNMNIRRREEEKAMKEAQLKRERNNRKQIWILEARSELSEAANRATNLYRMTMETRCVETSSVTLKNIQQVHSEARKSALHCFEPLIKKFSFPECKLYIDLAHGDIKNLFSFYLSREKTRYKNSLKAAHTSSVRSYQENMDALGAGVEPLPDLEQHHMTARETALNILRALCDNSEMYLMFINKAQKDIEEKFKTLQVKNDRLEKISQDKELALLDATLKQAVQVYQGEMYKHCSDISASPDIFNRHIVVKNQCIFNFKFTAAACDQEKVNSSLKELEKELQLQYDSFEEMQGKKLSFLREKEQQRPGTLNYPIGIDLGTTNCCVAVYDGTAVKIITNNIGKRTTPSTVYIGSKGPIFGEPAMNRGFSDPMNSISEMKRIIGRKFDDPVVQSLMKRWSFAVCDKNGDPSVLVTNGDNKQSFLPEEISGMILGEMKRLASVHLNSEVFDAVVTIPAYFNELQREATKRACAQAGINVLRIINEPTAAAIAYGIQTNCEDVCTVLVFDFGGGTCDVSILEMERGRYTVKASHGDNELGGEDFDDNLTEYLAEIHDEKYGVSLEPTDFRRLRRQCEKAKQELTDYSECEVLVERINGSSHDLREKVSQEKFDEINADLYPRILEPVRQCLLSAGLEAVDIDDVVMVGGSSRMPKVQKMIKKFFPDIDIKFRINPDEAIAYGAAIQAALSSGHYGIELHVVDITPISLGIGILHNRMSIVTPKNTELPSKKTEIFVTTVDNQETVGITVYQGEHPENEFLNTRIGKFSLCDLVKAPAGQTEVYVTFKINEDGILEVTAREVSNCTNCKTVTINKCVK